MCRQKKHAIIILRAQRFGKRFVNDPYAPGIYFETRTSILDEAVHFAWSQQQVWFQITLSEREAETNFGDPQNVV